MKNSGILEKDLEALSAVESYSKHTVAIKQVLF